jgi:HD-like signal output (HDOD) protein
MLSRWLSRSDTAQPVGSEELALLRPYSGLPQDLLESAASVVERKEVKQGLITDALPADQAVFLQHGKLQLQTKTGYLLHLEADTPLARFPLPHRSALVSLYASETCRFLIVPESVAPAPLDHQDHHLQRPELLPDETDAIEQLRTYFRKDHCELPSLPDLALKIGKAIDDTKNDNEDIARLIQLDPALTARIISVVNSAAFGGVQKITSTQQATARLGRRKVRSLVYSCLLKSIFKVNSPGLKQRMEDLWQHSAYVAALSFVLGRQTPGIDPEQALLAGLVHDIGAVAVIGGINRYPVLARRPEVMNYAIDSMRLEAGSLTLREWHLEDTFLEVVRNAANWQRIGSAIPDNVDVVVLARLHALIGSSDQSQLPRIDQIPAFAKLARGELTPRHSLVMLEEAEADVREVRSLIGGG